MGGRVYSQDDRRVFLATKTLTREKITAPEGARFPVGRLVDRDVNGGISV